MAGRLYVKQSPLVPATLRQKPEIGSEYSVIQRHDSLTIETTKLLPNTLSDPWYEPSGCGGEAIGLAGGHETIWADNRSRPGTGPSPIHDPGRHYLPAAPCIQRGSSLKIFAGFDRGIGEL